MFPSPDVAVFEFPYNPDVSEQYFIVKLVRSGDIIPIPPPVKFWPEGKGYFIWNLSRCANGSPTQLAARAKDAGLKWVTIKIADAGGAWNGDIRRWVEELRAVGMGVWGWQYVYGVKPEMEADVAAERVREFDLDGFMIDAEAEYKAPGKAGPARIYTTRLRASLPDKGIGLCAYRYPSLHRELPWNEFLSGCDFHCPQVYWIGSVSATAPGSQLARSVAELKALRDLPVIPTGVACDNPYAGGTWRPTVAQINNFNATAHTLGLPGLCWWSWQHAEAIPEFWNSISGHEWQE